MSRGVSHIMKKAADCYDSLSYRLIMLSMLSQFKISIVIKVKQVKLNTEQEPQATVGSLMRKILSIEEDSHRHNMEFCPWLTLWQERSLNL